MWYNKTIDKRGMKNLNMDFYGWKIKIWNFNQNNVEDKRKEMNDWCEKRKHKYQFRNVFVNNAWAVEYKRLLKM